MYSRLFCYFCMLAVASAWQMYHWDRYNKDRNLWTLPFRLIDLMRSVYADLSQQIADMNPQRFAYEQSPHYEQGFLFSEIIERYRKMVEQVRQLTEYKANTLYNVLDRVEYIQKLYLEIFHLVNMMHEIPRKYANVPGFAEVKEGEEQVSNVALDFFNEKERQRKKARLEKKMNKIRDELMKKGLQDVYASYFDNVANYQGPTTTTGRVTRWPLDYGWEMPYWKYD